MASQDLPGPLLAGFKRRRVPAIAGRDAFLWQSLDRKRFELFRRRKPPFLRSLAYGGPLPDTSAYVRSL